MRYVKHQLVNGFYTWHLNTIGMFADYFIPIPIVQLYSGSFGINPTQVIITAGN